MEKVFGVKLYNPRNVKTVIKEDRLYKRTTIEIHNQYGLAQLSVTVKSKAVWRVARANVKLITKYNLYMDLQDLTAAKSL